MEQFLILIFLAGTNTVQIKADISTATAQIKEKQPLTLSAVTNTVPVKLIADSKVLAYATVADFRSLRQAGLDPKKIAFSTTSTFKPVIGKPGETWEAALKRYGWEPVPVKPPKEEEVVKP